MNWLVRMTAELEVSMNSVERVVEYNPMESEAAAIVGNNRPASNWPPQGVIQVENLVVRYRPELPPVISKLSFKTKAREKVHDHSGLEDALHHTFDGMSKQLRSI